MPEGDGPDRNSIRSIKLNPEKDRQIFRQGKPDMRKTSFCKLRVGPAAAKDGKVPPGMPGCARPEWRGNALRKTAAGERTGIPAGEPVCIRQYFTDSGWVPGVAAEREKPRPDCCLCSPVRIGPDVRLLHTGVRVRPWICGRPPYLLRRRTPGTPTAGRHIGAEIR